MESLTTTLAERAIEIGAFQVRPHDPVTWASGYRMPVYTDNRLMLRDPAARRLVAEALTAEVIDEIDRYTVVAGTASAGIAPALLLAERFGRDFLYVRSGAKEHGLARRIEGLTRDEAAATAPLSGHTVLLVEDLLSTGGSSASAAQALMEAGASVPRCLAIVTYGFARVDETFAALPKRCEPTAILRAGDLIAAARTAGHLDDASLAVMEDWLADPFGWQERHR